MLPDTARGNVLVITEDRAASERLCRWIAAIGELPLAATDDGRFLSEPGLDERIDLVVTEVADHEPSGRALLERLARGELLFGVPQLHIVSEPSTRGQLHELNPDLAAACLMRPADENELKARIRLAAELGRLRREISRISTQDPLTGAYNRRYLLMRLEQECSRARRYNSPLSLVIVDIDRLKAINEQYGLKVGDRSILQISRVLQAHVRKEDLQGRLGETSFLCLLPGTDYRGAAVFANKVRGDSEAFHVKLPDREVVVKVSAGIASFGAVGEGAGGPELLQAAEAALGEAKRRGGNRVYIDEAALRQERRVVVIADPDPELLDMAEDMLGMDDMRVIRAESASTLLAAVGNRRPDLVILDLAMAQQEGGLVRKLQDGSGPPVPVLALCPGSNVDPRQLASLGLDRYITKPFSVSILRSVARDLMDEPRPVTARAAV